MAISKVIYKSSSQDTGTVWMDSTPATAAAADITAPKTAMLADGVLTTGTRSGGGSSTLITKNITENGTYDAEDDNADGYSSVTVNVSGGGSVTVEEKAVNFIDDVTSSIVYSYTASEFANLSSLPENPSHSGLTSQGWNWSLSDAKAYVAKYGKLWIGQSYVTDDGKTRIYITLDDPNYLSPYLTLPVNGTAVVDWGDGSPTVTMTGTSNSTMLFQLHEYATIGSYVITLNPTSGKILLYNGTSATAPSLLRSTSLDTGRAYDRAYAGAITKVEIGANAWLSSYAFINCTSLKTVTIPTNATALSTQLSGYIFNDCYSLKTITIPNGFLQDFNHTFSRCYACEMISWPNSLYSFINGYTFSDCYSLRSVTISGSATEVPMYFADNCRGLKTFVIPDSVTDIGNYAFRYCYSLKSVTIPSGVTRIGNYAFRYCYGIQEYHLLPETVPTFGTSVFDGIMPGTVIYVPKGKLSDYQTATNASAYASYMQEEPA